MKFERLENLVIKIGSGVTPRGGKKGYSDSGNVRLIRSQNIYNNFFSYGGLVYISDIQADKMKNVSVFQNDILINITGDSVARAMIVKDEVLPARVNQHVSIIRVSEKLDVFYLIAYLTSKKTQLQLISLASTGGTRPALTKSMLNQLEIPIVPLEKQQKIGNYYKKITEKIDLNSQIITTLEELASTIFKRWFVDFEFPDENDNPYKSSGGKMVASELGDIPEEWEVKRLGDFSTIVMGQSPKGESYNYDKIGTPLVNGASDFKNGIVTPLKYTTEPKKVTKKGDYIFGVRATVGNVTETHLEYAIGRGAGIARSKGIVGKEFLYFNLISIINYLESTASGSVYINISRKDLDDFKVVYPSEKVLGLFHDTTLYMLTEKQNKYKENILLQESRDSLLPKLLSGEIEIPQSEDV